MAQDKTLKLSIQIAGKIDKSLEAVINQTQSQISGLSRTFGKAGTAGLAAMGAAMTGIAATIIDCTKAAKDFETQMGDVVKYVDGLADAAGKISDKIDPNTGRSFADNYGIMKDALQQLSTEIPMTTEELTKLAAAAGQSGKGINDLIQYDSNGNIQGFLRDVAKLGTAWDIEADLAGDYAAKWEKSFNMSHDEVMVLADQINYLGANSATTAAEIAQAVNASASVGQMAGIDAATTAALADAMLATGVSADRVGTSIKRTFTNFTLGSSATKAMKEQWEELGFTAEGVAKSMQKDSVGTLMSIFDAINALPDYKQVAALKNLVGQWALEGDAKIVGNMKVFTDALNMINDADAYTGSMEREFIIKADTAESIDKMMGNAWTALKQDFGDEFLPVKKQFSQLMIDVMGEMRNHMPELVQLGSSLADILAQGVSKLGDALQTALPYVQSALGYVANNGDQVVKVLGGMAAVFAGMKTAPLIETLLGGAGSLLGGGKGGILSLFTGGQKFAGNMGMKATMLAGGARMGVGFGASGKGGILGTMGSALAGMLATGQNWGGLFSGNNRTTRAAVTNLRQTLRNQAGNGGLGGMLLNMFQGTGAGKYLLGIGSAAGGVKASSGGLFGAIGQIGAHTLGAGTAIPGALGSSLGAVGQFGGSLLNFGGAVLAPVTTMFGSLLSGALPIVGVISSIIAVLAILYDNLDGVRNIIGSVFGQQGLQVFDTFRTGLDGVLGYVNNLINGGLATALSGIREKFVGLFGDSDMAATAGQTFDSVVMILQSVLGVVGQIVDFAQTYVRPIIEEIFTYLTGTVLPIILDTFNAAAPIISSIITNVGSAVMSVAGLIAQAIQAVLPIIQTIITTILSIGSYVIPMVLGAFNGIIMSISPIIESIKMVFSGLIEFIGGVFTGNWQQVWQGVQDIFGGIFDGLVELAKLPINAVIGLINGAIGALNTIGITIPEWIPVFGGQSFSFNIPELPYLAKGGFTDGPSIAGEAGREAVISFQSGVRRQNIDTWARAGRMLGLDDFGGRQEAQLSPFDGTRQTGDTLTFSPQITIQGNADQSVVDNLTSQMQTMFERWYEQRQRRQLRTAY